MDMAERWWDDFRWEKMEHKPEVEWVNPDDIMLILDESDIVHEGTIDNPIEGIPLSEEEARLREFIPEDELRVILDDRDKLSGDWIIVISSNVNAIKYNIETSSMDVEYQYGRYYRYYDVPPAFFIDFFHAHSPGRFVWEHIRRPQAYTFVRFGGRGVRPPGGDNIQNIGGI